MASLIAPLLRQVLSPYQILAIHPELNISEKTLYNYIESGVFREIAGITSLDPVSYTHLYACGCILRNASIIG